MNKIFYFDLDGVLANFEGKIVSIFGEPYSTQLWPRIAAEYPHIFKFLDPIHPMVMLFNSMSLGGYDVRVLSAKPSMIDMRYVEQDKISWCSERLNTNNVTIVNKAEDKQRYSREGVVLIDDNVISCEQWSSRGGIALLHKTYAQTRRNVDAILYGSKK